MKDETEIVDRFEYKGREITVHLENLKYYFVYKEKGKEIKLPISEIKDFISSAHSHATLNDNTIDMIEKSVKINSLLYNLDDLEIRLSKYN